MSYSGGHSASVLCVDVHQASCQVVSGGEDGRLCLWAPEGQLLTSYTQDDSECTSAVFSHNNPHIVYAAFGEEVHMLDLNRSKDPVFVFKSNQDEVNQLVLDSKDKFLAAGDDSGEVKVYGLQDRKVFKSLRHKHTNICSTVSFRPGRPWELLSGGLDCRLVHWDFSKPKCLHQFNTQQLFATPGESPHMINPPFVHHIATSPSGAIVACALENGQLPILDASNKKMEPKYALFAHRLGVSQVQFANEDILISAGNDSTVVKWDLSKAELFDPGCHQASGDLQNIASSAEEEKYISITSLCQLKTLQRSCKINWMAIYSTDTALKLFIADQTTDISVITL